jgi:hypothetical protein
MTESSSSLATLEVRDAGAKNRGLFTRASIARGTRILEFQGFLVPTAELRDEYFALQVDHDLWLCSYGNLLDDCSNHSCDPNAGFTTGDLVLYALRDIEPGEEICWDYSTAISELGWTLDCLCGSPRCRKVVLSWGELAPAERERWRHAASMYGRLHVNQNRASWQLALRMSET